MKITKEEAELLSLAIQALEREENDFWSEWSFSEEQLKAKRDLNLKLNKLLGYKEEEEE